MHGKLEVSILIPIFNQSVTPLAAALSTQASSLGWLFEIRCYDDASTSSATLASNSSLSAVPGVIYKQLPHNIGRSAIRNKMAREAAFAKLLFLDCDAAIPDPDFLERYGRYAAAADVICGGRIYLPEPPAKEYSLHWHYGTYKESQTAEERRKHPTKSFMFNNVFISKHIFQLVKLDESIQTYGHEDTKFGYELAQRNIPVLHIPNPVIHVGLDSNEAFLHKTKEGVYNLYKIYRQSNLASDTKLVKTWLQLRKLRLTGLFCRLYDTVRPLILQQLLSNSPNLLLLDLYKLRIFCQAAQS